MACRTRSTRAASAGRDWNPRSSLGARHSSGAIFPGRDKRRATGVARPQHMSYSFQFRDVFAAWEFLLEGLVLTLELSVVTMIVGLIIGMAGAGCRTYG